MPTMTKPKLRLPRVIAAIVVLVLGLGVFFYPAISGLINERSQTQVISNFEEELDGLNENEKAESFASAQAYNESLVSNQKDIYDPFAQDQETLNENDNISYMQVGESIGYVQIPKIGIKSPLYEGTSEDVLQRGIGWLKGTSLPVGGTSTHSVLTGHRGLPTAKLFTDLDQLEVGDEFFIRNVNEILAYKVQEIKIIDPHDVAALSIVEGKDLVTLLTCHPYMVNSERLLVTGERIPYTGQLDELNQNFLDSLSAAEFDLLRTILIASAVLILVLGIRYFRRKRKERRRRNGLAP